MSKVKRTDNYINECREVGKRLRFLRNQNKYRLKEVEKLSNNIVTSSMLSNYESGKKMPSLSTLKILGKLYNTSVDFIIYGNDPNQNNFNNYADIVICLENIKKCLNLSKRANIGPFKTVTNAN